VYINTIKISILLVNNNKVYRVNTYNIF